MLSFHLKIKGILKKTGTSTDKLVLVSLEALKPFTKIGKLGQSYFLILKKEKETKDLDLTPKEITAAVIKLKSPITIFKIQREINDYQIEPLQAIIPGIVLTKLWQIVQ